MTVENPFLDRTQFEDEVFSDLELPKADLSDREFVRCTFRKALLPEANWTGARFEGCDARNANFADAVGVFIDPARNKVRDARIGIATALMLAASFGLRVHGYDQNS
jgi:fluoroquinolone resistance protein